MEPRCFTHLALMVFLETGPLVSHPYLHLQIDQYAIRQRLEGSSRRLRLFLPSHC